MDPFLFRWLLSRLVLEGTAGYNAQLLAMIRTMRENPAIINRAGNAPAHQQLAQNQLVGFRNFTKMPPELRSMVWGEAANLEPPRILRFEAKSDLATTFDINLFSRPNPLIVACAESRRLNRDVTSVWDIFNNTDIGVLAASPQFEMIHFGPSYQIEHLENFEKAVGTSSAANVQSLILEMEFADFQTPLFFRICQLFPKLQSIIFVFREANNPSNGIGGHMVFTDRYVPMAGGRVRTNRGTVPEMFSFCLKTQLETRRMQNVHPKIVFLNPVRAQVQEG